MTTTYREKFERLKSQAELKAQWADAMLRGEAFPRQFQTLNGWNDVTMNGEYWNPDAIYRRKPEPTLEERNKAVRAEWEEMEKTTVGAIRKRDGKRYCCEFRFHLPDEEGAWEKVYPLWTDNGEYRIRELPSPRIEPFTFETCPLGANVVWKDYTQKAVVTTVSKTEIYVGLSKYTFSRALELLWIIPDPSKPDERRPFGREVCE